MASPVDKFEVNPYTIDNLKRLLSDYSEASEATIALKAHTDFFREYFEIIGAQTIICESGYIDHDYLEDYIKYYVRCFQDYKRKCTRLHFFSTSFDAAQLKYLISNGGVVDAPLNKKILQENYLGFIVLKPLPKTVIGRTCLTTYPSEGRRNFPNTRNYFVNLFGIDLEVKNSLAFQEQDTVVAACATSALWSAFQGTGVLFHHRIPSPSEITNYATETLTRNSRAFPSRGLDAIEMARAIKKVGLEPYHVSATNKHNAIATVYAYLKAHIPVILGLHIFDQDHNYIGMHAVAITGYSLNEKAPLQSLNGNFLLKATGIDKFYVHDDQVGPFSRMNVDDIIVNYNNQEHWSLSTEWGKPQTPNSRAVPELLLIPLNPKIRIPFSCIHDKIVELDSILKSLLPSVDFMWDIYASSINDLKNNVFNEPSLTPQKREDFLLQGMPKHLWRAIACFNDSKIFELIFDATDIEQGDFFIRGIVYDDQLFDLLRQAFLHPFFDESSFDTIRSTIKWFRGEASTE